jgi:hypothetical protein
MQDTRLMITREQRRSRARCVGGRRLQTNALQPSKHKAQAQLRARETGAAATACLRETSRTHLYVYVPPGGTRSSFMSFLLVPSFVGAPSSGLVYMTPCACTVASKLHSFCTRER